MKHLPALRAALQREMGITKRLSRSSPAFLSSLTFALAPQLPLLYALLVALVAGRFAAARWDTMWLWGLNTQRFNPEPWGWVLGLAAALPLVPPIGRRLEPAVTRFGDLLIRHRGLRFAAATGMAALVVLLNDRTWVTGDFLIRSGAVAWGTKQSLPLEVLLFDQLPRTVLPVIHDVLILTRLFGALAAFVVGLATIEVACLLAPRGGLLIAVWSVLAFGGYLATLTGLGKPAGLLCAATALSGLFAFRVMANRQSAANLGALGLTVAGAILLHRGGLLLLPCWIVALSVALHHERCASHSWRLFPTFAAFAPAVAILVTGKDLLRIFLTFDMPYHIAGVSLAGQPAPWSTGTLPLRVIDLLNLQVLLVPVGIPILIAGVFALRRLSLRPDLAVSLALAIPWLLAMVVIRPQQGVFRDIDVFAPAGVAIALLCGSVLRSMPFGTRARETLVAVAVISASATLQLLLCFHDPAYGLARVSAYVSERPARPEGEKARTWDFVTLRAVKVGDWAMALRASREATKYAPSPRFLMTEAIAATYTGDYAGARVAYSAVLERTPNEPLAWVGLAGIAVRLHERALADSAFRKLSQYPRGGTVNRQIREFIENFPEVMPSGRPTHAGPQP